MAVCERGMPGVRMTTLDLGDFLGARRLVRAINDSIGIDAAAEHAMLVGCLRGWDSAMADPDFLRATVRRFMDPPQRARCAYLLH